MHECGLAEFALTLGRLLRQDVTTTLLVALELASTGGAKTLLRPGFGLHLGHKAGLFAPLGGKKQEEMGT